MVRQRRLWAILVLLGLLVHAPPASAGALSSVSVALADEGAGATTTATVTFTTASSVPADGRIEVTFPVGFDVSGVGAGDGACASMDGAFTTSVVGQLVRITRSGGSSQAGGQTETCTVANVVNPPVSGATGTFTVETYAFLLLVWTLQDVGVASAVTLDPNALAGTNVQPASLLAGDSGDVTVSFTTFNALPLDGKLEVTFPAGFDVSGATASCASMDGALAVGVAGQVVTLTRSGGSAQAPAAETCTLGNVLNPPSAGSTGTYALRTLNSLGVAIDQDLAVAADTLAANALAATNVEPASLLAGATGTVTASFTTANALPSDGVVRITFPAGYDVSGATSGDCSSMDGTFATSVAGSVVTLTRSGGTSEPAGAQTCTVAGVRNPQVSGTTGAYALTTLTSALAAIDQDLAVAADTILANALAGTTVTPADLDQGATSIVTAAFTTVNPLPADGVVEITFPAGFDLSGVGAADGACSSLDGTLVTSVAGQVVKLTRQGDGTVEAAGAQACTVADVVNPTTPGTTGDYAVRTLNTALAAIDQDLAVVGSLIEAGGITSVVIDLGLDRPNRIIDVTFTWVGTATVPDDAKVLVTFPAGFDLTTVTDATCAFDGTVDHTVNGQLVTITRQGDGTAALPGSRTCTVVDAKTPPDTGLTDTFALSVTNGADVDLETDLSVAGVTIVAVDSGFGPSTAASGNYGSGGSSSSSSGPTVVTDPADPTVTLVDVEGGTLTILHLGADAPKFPLPDGFEPTDVYFDLSSADPIQVATLHVRLPDGVDAARAVLLHGTGGAWQPLEGSVQDRVLVVTVTDFSPFWLVEDVQGPHDLTVVADDDTLRAFWAENQGRADAILWVDGAVLASADDATKLTASIAHLAPGTHRVTLRVTDPAGHETVTRATLSLEEDAAPSVVQEEPSGRREPVPGPALPLVAAGLLALALAARRRRL